LTIIASYKGPGAESEEKREPVSDIDTGVVDSLKVLDPRRPIREADIGQLNDLTGGGSFSVEARADAAILVAERERVATE